MYGWSVFWFVMGALSLVMIIGFKYFAEDRGIKMNWWKWLITIAWWAGMLFAVAVPFTFMGEGEPGAGAWMMLFSVVPAAIMGFVVWRIITANWAA
jgi:hypothetical protein